MGSLFLFSLPCLQEKLVMGIGCPAHLRFCFDLLKNATHAKWTRRVSRLGLTLCFIQEAVISGLMGGSRQDSKAWPGSFPGAAVICKLQRLLRLAAPTRQDDIRRIRALESVTVTNLRTGEAIVRSRGRWLPHVAGPGLRPGTPGGALLGWAMGDLLQPMSLPAIHRRVHARLLKGHDFRVTGPQSEAKTVDLRHPKPARRPEFFPLVGTREAPEVLTSGAFYWSGRTGSNRRRSAWEVKMSHYKTFVFNILRSIAFRFGWILGDGLKPCNSATFSCAWAWSLGRETIYPMVVSGSWCPIIC